MEKKFNIICIKWGDEYKAEDVNKLYRMITRNTTQKIEFFCFTDNGQDLDENIILKPLPKLNTIKEYQTKYAYRKEAALCDDDLGGLRGQRVFFFDLDVVIISSLDELFFYPKDDKFYIINDWNTRGDHVGQATCYSWQVGTLGYVKTYYEQNPKKVVDRYFTASQEYLSSKIIEKYGALNFWPDHWFCSFRFHCIEKFWPLRYFKAPTIPKDRVGLKVISFHGSPKPQDAINGVWKLRNQGWKRIYKVCKPTAWIKQYWY